MATSHVRAAEGAPTEEDRLRAALRQVTEQLESMQSQVSALQANQAAAAQDKQDALAKLEALKKQAAASTTANERTIALLKRQVTGLVNVSSRLTQELADAKAEGDKAAELAKTNGAERDKLAAEDAARLKRIVGLQAKNVALFMVANEILDRYQDFGFGTALKVKEPFVGATRARLETLVQDYRDRIVDAREKP